MSSFCAICVSRRPIRRYKNYVKTIFKKGGLSKITKLLRYVEEEPDKLPVVAAYLLKLVKKNIDDIRKIETGITAIKELTSNVPQELVQTMGETVFNTVRLMFNQQSVSLNLYGIEVLEVFEIQRDSADQVDTLEFLHFLLDTAKNLQKGSLSFHEQKLLCLPTWKCLNEVILNENDEIVRSETTNILPVVLEGMASEEQKVRELSTKILRKLTKSALVEDGKVLLVHVERYLTIKAAWTPHQYVARILDALVDSGLRGKNIVLDFLQKLDDSESSLLMKTRIIYTMSWLWEERIKGVEICNPAGIITLLMKKVINILKRVSSYLPPVKGTTLESFVNQVLKSVVLFCDQISGGDSLMVLSFLCGELNSDM